jgi:hypothetical protein
MRVDLDAVDRHIEPFNGCPECKTREVVAELRAAREVVEAVRSWWDADGDEAALHEEGVIGRAMDAYERVAAYDQAVSP